MGLEKLNSGLDPGETFFPNSASDLGSAETFQISRNVGLDIDEIVCLLDSQPWFQGPSSSLCGCFKGLRPPIFHGRFQGSQPWFRACIFKRLWSPGIDSKEGIPPTYVAWRAGTITLFLSVPNPGPIDCLKIPAQVVEAEPCKRPKN